MITSKDQIKDVVHRFLPDSDSSIRKLLMNGFKDIKKRYKYYEEQDKIDESQFGNIKPAIVDNRNSKHWVDNLIRDRMGAVRDGLMIVWNLEDGVHKFDPFTGDITYGSDSI